MGRKTKINEHFNEEIWKTVNEENKYLLDEFQSYLNSVDRSDATIFQYMKDIKGFFCWFHDNCKNKEFYNIKKRDVIKYQGYLLNDLGLSSSRVRRLKSSLSSLSNFIVKILDEDYPDFKNIINFIEAPQKNAVREKTILTEEDLKLICDTFVSKGEIQKACYFAILASSGMRKSEAFRIKVSDFSEENKISEAVYKSRPIKTKGRGKTGKVISKYFLISILEPYLSLWLDKRKEEGIDNEYLFANKSGKSSISSGDYWCKLATEILGKQIYSHSLRHYLTTYMSKNNIPTKIIQEYNGWQNSVMIEIYDDGVAEDSFAEYFSKDGIKKVENKNIDEL